MLDQVSTLVLLFGLIFGLNIIPAFAPPTWMAVAFIGFEFPGTNTVLLALVAATAATLGRITLAKLSHWLVREKLLSDAHRKNIDIVKERLEKRAVLTLSVFLFYALSPLPSNFLFIAYGLTGLPLLRIALPFFIGRTASYSFFILSGAAAGRRFSHRFDRVGVLRERMVHRLPSCSLRRGFTHSRESIGRLCLMSTGSCGYPNQAPQPMSARWRSPATAPRKTRWD
jgi:uncharacterized membrane protein YdjX (TVP38/TMEM64 family)